MASIRNHAGAGTRPLQAVVGAGAALLALVAPSCGRGASTEPLPAAIDGPVDQMTERIEAPAGVTTTAPPTPAEAGDPGPPGQDATITSEVDDLLRRYDAALTALSSEPAAVADPQHPLTLEWHEVVAPGSGLDLDMRARIGADLVDSAMVVRPGPEGTAYRTLALEVHEGPEGSLLWEHCGYSPGVGMEISTGAVLDDRRASTRGAGAAERRPDGSLVIVELRDDDLVLLEPGVPDPCPELQRSARAGGPR